MFPSAGASGRASALGTEGVCVTELGLLEAAREALPFQLTGGQELALENILRDMQGPLPMMCLLQVPPQHQHAQEDQSFTQKLAQLLPSCVRFVLHTAGSLHLNTSSALYFMWHSIHEFLCLWCRQHASV